MSGTSSAEVYDQVAALPAEALALLDEAPGVFASRVWWEVVAGHAVPAGGRALFVAVRSAGQIAGVFPMLRVGGRLGGLTTPYTCEYVPLLARGLSAAERAGVLGAFGRFCRRAGVVRLDALPPGDWDGLAAAVRFDHFGNWYEDVGGLGWAGYLAGRTGALRETVKRRLRRAEKLPGARFELFREAAVDVFEAVYRRSWKEPEPFPSFNGALMRGMAGLGLLRLGVWSIGAEAVAVQFWVVRDGCAIVLKLAHDEACKAVSPGTVLTALMLRHLLDNEGVARIDFGRGDDVYKQGWAGSRRQMTGVLLVNPWRVSGALALARHAAGRVRARLSGRSTQAGQRSRPT